MSVGREEGGSATGCRGRDGGRKVCVWETGCVCGSVWECVWVRKVMYVLVCLSVCQEEEGRGGGFPKGEEEEG